MKYGEKPLISVISIYHIFMTDSMNVSVDVSVEVSMEGSMGISADMS